MTTTQVAVIAVIAVAMMFIAGCTSTDMGIPSANNDGVYKAMYNTFPLTVTISAQNTQFEYCVGDVCQRSAMVDKGSGVYTIGGAPSKMVFTVISFENGGMIFNANDGSILKFTKMS